MRTPFQVGLEYLRRLQMLNKVNVRLARGAAGAAARDLDAAAPRSWEFSGFSQNGEDGIIDFLTRKILRPNHYFVEIGASEGLENNSAWLSIVRRFSGLMIEGSADAVRRADALHRGFSLGVEAMQCFVTCETVGEVCSKMLHRDPDVFSLDIDGNDYHVAKALLESGLSPKVIVVEYNSAFGPTRRCTIPYQKDFNFLTAHSTQLYYGVSVSAWRSLFENAGYRFVTVDQNGVNAFFAKETEFDPQFLEKLRGEEFRENFWQRRKFQATHEDQMKLIKQLPILEIN